MHIICRSKSPQVPKFDSRQMRVLSIVGTRIRFRGLFNLGRQGIFGFYKSPSMCIISDCTATFWGVISSIISQPSYVDVRRCETCCLIIFEYWDLTNYVKMPCHLMLLVFHIQDGSPIKGCWLERKIRGQEWHRHTLHDYRADLMTCSEGSWFKHCLKLEIGKMSAP